MLHDWKSLDLDSINKQILWATNTTTEIDFKCLRQGKDYNCHQKLLMFDGMTFKSGERV
jgi:hypothetical protein